MEQILEENMVCNNAAQTEAAVKKHEAISAEILARVILTGRHFSSCNFLELAIF